MGRITFWETGANLSNYMIFVSPRNTRCQWPVFKKISKNVFTRKFTMSINIVCNSLYFSKILKKRRKPHKHVFYLDNRRVVNSVTMSKGPTARKKKSLVALMKFHQRTNLYCFANLNDSLFLAFVSSCSPILVKPATTLNSLCV